MNKEIKNKENPKVIMRGKTKYTSSTNCTCIDNLMEDSIELSLIHCGKEVCQPLHIFQGSRDEYIIHFITKGKGIFSVGNKLWELEEGQFFVVFPHTKLTYVSNTDDPWNYHWLGLRGITVEKLLFECGITADSPINSCDNIDSIIDLCDKIMDAKQLTYSNELRRRGLLLEMFANLVENHQRNRGIVNNDDFGSNIYVTHAMEFIRKNYANPIHVSNIAEHVGISRTHLNNCFQKELGLTIQKFLIDYRLHIASYQLIDTTKSINEIAYAVGYSDPLAFSKAFKKKFDLSPKAYRESK